MNASPNGLGLRDDNLWIIRLGEYSLGCDSGKRHIRHLQESVNNNNRTSRSLTMLAFWPRPPRCSMIESYSKRIHIDLLQTEDVGHGLPYRVRNLLSRLPRKYNRDVSVLLPTSHWYRLLLSSTLRQSRPRLSDVCRSKRLQ